MLPQFPSRLRLLPRLIGAACLAIAAGTAHAQTFKVQRYQVAGDNPLSESETANVLASFTGDVSLEKLQEATAALEARLREKGFSLHRVSLPAQPMASVIKLDIVRFTIGKVRVPESAYYDAANLTRSVPELAVGTTPNFQVVAKQILIANESPSKQVAVSLRESEEPNKIDAELRVTGEKPWSLGLTVTNSGSQSTGKDRFTFTAQHANLFNADHIGSVAYTTTSADPNNVQQWGVTYRVPFYALGGVLSANATKSNVLGGFGGFDVTGAGQSFGLQYTHHFSPADNLRRTASIGYDLKQYDAAFFNGVAISPLGLKQTSAPITVGYGMRAERGSFAFGTNAELAFNTGSGSGNTLVAYQDSDPRVSTKNFVILRTNGSVVYQTENKTVFTGRVQSQMSGKALIPGEQFGLGGANSVRGITERAITGDSGLLVSAEVQLPAFTPNFRLLGFLDAGMLRNSVVTPLKPKNDSVASFGVGMRITMDRYASLSVDWARVLNGSSVASATGAQKGDMKAHVTFSLRY